jgi:hypothetical protein
MRLLRDLSHFLAARDDAMFLTRKIYWYLQEVSGAVFWDVFRSVVFAGTRWVVILSEGGRVQSPR